MMDAEKIPNDLLLDILREQRNILEDGIRRYGPDMESIRVLAALNEVIDYNTVPGEDELGRERS